MCTNCGGTGRILYQDPQAGQIRDMGACLSCAGSGEAS